MSNEVFEEYWKENIRLVLSLLGVWAFFIFIVQLIPGINSIVFLGWPLGYYMGAQGTLVVFLAIIFTYVKKMNEIDKKHNLEEE